MIKRGYLYGKAAGDASKMTERWLPRGDGLICTSENLTLSGHLDRVANEHLPGRTNAAPLRFVNELTCALLKLTSVAAEE